jgi:hypothetical protein
MKRMQLAPASKHTTPDSEPMPAAGTQLGRYVIVREIVKGTLCPLYLAHTQNHDQRRETADKLVRVIPLPQDLPGQDYHRIIEAIWDSTVLDHDWVLQVQDVVSGTASVAIIHDFIAGHPLHSIHQCVGGAGHSFPTEIAMRIALDLFDGIERSRKLCEARSMPWQPGCVSMPSLRVCDDGRTRTLDGLVMAAILRSPCMRTFLGDSLVAAPEMLDDIGEPDERTDVFAIGTVLAELIAGGDSSRDLVHALRRASDVDPSKRQSTLEEFACELVVGAEKVATHAEVAQFAAMFSPLETPLQSDVLELRRPLDDSTDNVARQS